jgi:hypothetical protein
MKKKEKFAIALLGALIVFTVASTNVSAASPSYVGVKKGDEFIWRASLNMANINATAIALIGEANWTYGYNMLMGLYKNETGMDFTGLLGAGVKVVVTNVTNEIPVESYLNATGLKFDIYTSGGNNNWTMEVNSTGMSSPMGYLVNPTMLNASTIIYGLIGTEIPFFTPVGLNFTMLADHIQTGIDSKPSTEGNFTAEAQGTGLKFTIFGTFLDYLVNSSGEVPFNITGLGDVVATVKWNSNGVFERGIVAYNGLTLVTAYLETSPTTSIPGYELPILAMAGGSAIIALVYIYKKKTKL